MTQRITHADVRRRRLRIAVLALAVASAATLIAARPADAGSYVTTHCTSTHDGGDAGWERTSDDYRERRRCGSGDGLQVYHDAGSTNQGRYGAWVWRAPAGSTFTSLQANASLANHSGHHGELRGRRTDGSEVEFGSEHNDFRVHEITGQFERFSAMLRCASGDGCRRADDDQAHAYVKGVFLRVDDRSAPTLAVDGGSLLAAPVVRGTRTLDFTASDRGGGVRRVSVEANGVELASDVRNCALADGFATALTPCPTATGGVWAVNTAHAALSTGPNTITACAGDLALDASPNRDCVDSDVWIDNACPSSPGDGGSRLTARFREAGERITVRSDRRVAIEGRVTDADGLPVAGGGVCALTRVATGGAPIVVGATGVTGSDGRYRLELAPGPNREVFVHHVAGNAVVARHGLELRSRVRPTLAVRPQDDARNGDRLRFQGTLPSPACEARIVKVQAKLGGKWQVFRTDRTNERCRFRTRYRLRTTSGEATYRFRALVPPQAGYPYERGSSRRRSVIATG